MLDSNLCGRIRTHWTIRCPETDAGTSWNYFFKVLTDKMVFFLLSSRLVHIWSQTWFFLSHNDTKSDKEEDSPSVYKPNLLYSGFYLLTCISLFCLMLEISFINITYPDNPMRCNMCCVVRERSHCPLLLNAFKMKLGCSLWTAFSVRLLAVEQLLVPN